MSKKGPGDKKEEVSGLYKDLASLRPSDSFDPSPEDYEKAVKVSYFCSHELIYRVSEKV